MASSFAARIFDALPQSRHQALSQEPLQWIRRIAMPRLIAGGRRRHLRLARHHALATALSGRAGAIEIQLHHCESRRCSVAFERALFARARPSDLDFVSEFIAEFPERSWTAAAPHPGLDLAAVAMLMLTGAALGLLIFGKLARGDPDGKGGNGARGGREQRHRPFPLPARGLSPGRKRGRFRALGAVVRLKTERSSPSSVGRCARALSQLLRPQ